MALPITGALMSLLSDTVAVRAPLTRDSFGKVLTWGPSTTYQARVGGQHKVMRAVNGQERISTVVVWILGEYNLTIDHEYTLPSRFSPRIPVALKVECYADENAGGHHTKVHFE